MTLGRVRIDAQYGEMVRNERSGGQSILGRELRGDHPGTTRFCAGEQRLSRTRRPTFRDPAEGKLQGADTGQRAPAPVMSPDQDNRMMKQWSLRQHDWPFKRMIGAARAMTTPVSWRELELDKMPPAMETEVPWSLEAMTAGLGDLDKAVQAGRKPNRKADRLTDFVGPRVAKMSRVVQERESVTRTLEVGGDARSVATLWGIGG